MFKLFRIYRISGIDADLSMSYKFIFTYIVCIIMEHSFITVRNDADRLSHTESVITDYHS